MRGRLLSVLLLVSAGGCATEAALQLTTTQIRPAHEHECYVPKIKSFIPLGEVRFLSKCRALSCSSLGSLHLIRIASCNVPYHDETCVEVHVDRAALYPACCLRYECPNLPKAPK